MSQAEPLLELAEWRVRRGGRMALAVAHLAVPAGQVLAVIGPNGSGKSTLLLSMARLLTPEAGRLLYRGEPVRKGGDLEYRRRLALVLQDPLLLDAPVFDNVALGLRFRKLERGELRRRVDEWLERLGVSHLRSRRGRNLSGGEAQRVSLARAFALQPELLLLDEPFSALDAPTRAQLLADFKGLLAETGLTTVLVTHDLDEALYLGDQVAVLHAGRLKQVGKPQEVFAAPADPEVAAFVGVETVVEGRVVNRPDGRLRVSVGGQQLVAEGAAPDGLPVLVCLRPEEVTLWPANAVLNGRAGNVLPASVQSFRRQGPLTHVQLDVGFPLVALVTRATAEELDLQAGQALIASIQPAAVHLIPR